jgi:hypothetical protein
MADSRWLQPVVGVSVWVVGVLIAALFLHDRLWKQVVFLAGVLLSVLAARSVRWWQDNRA